MKLMLISLLFIFFNEIVSAQSLAINTDGSTANISALLDVKSTAKGMLIPRMTAVQRTAIATPASGLLVYDTDSAAFSYYDGSVWFFLNSSINIGKAWSTRGNSGTLPTDFIGTSDAQDLFFKIYNTNAGYIKNTSNNTAFGYRSGNTVTGTNSTLLGSYVGSSAMSGSYNTGVGVQTFEFSTTGSFNTGVGWYNLRSGITGNNNTALGTGNIDYTTGSNNIGIGQNTLASTFRVGQNYSKNIAIGYLTQNKQIHGSGNIAIGEVASFSDTTGTRNIAIGTAALRTNTNKSELIAIGDSALYSNNDFPANTLNAVKNIAIGSRALFNNTTGYNNIALGYESQKNTTNGVDNVSVGVNSLLTNTIGGSNAAFGNSALKNLSGGSGFNIAMGDSAATNLVTGFDNSVVGRYAFKDHTIGYGNTAIGSSTMGGGTGGDFNTAIGHVALYSTNGFYNVAIGFSAGYYNTSGSYNSFLGYGTGSSATTLSNTTTVGSNAYATAANSMVLGSINGTNGAAADTRVGIGVTAPSEKLEIGNGRLRFRGYPGPGNSHGIIWTNNAGTTDRAFLGMETDDLFSIYNYGFAGGWNIRVHNTSGEMGVNTQPLTTNNDSRLQVKQSGTQNGIGVIRAGGAEHWDIWLDNNATPDYNFYRNGTLRSYISWATGAYTVVSDKRFKKDITPLSSQLQNLNKLKLYNFRYSDNSADDKLNVGFMAQDVQPLFPEAVKEITNKDGSTNLGIQYQYMSVYAIKAIQEQQVIIDKQQKTIDDLEKRLEKLEGK